MGSSSATQESCPVEKYNLKLSKVKQILMQVHLYVYIDICIVYINQNPIHERSSKHIVKYING